MVLKVRNIFKDMHDGDIPLEDAEKDQVKFKTYLGYIRQGSPKNRSEEQNNSSVKWAVLAHFKSQPCGQNFKLKSSGPF